MDSRSLAIFDNYHLPRKNARFDFIIWHGHLWGGRFQMSGVGERQVTTGILQAQKDGDDLNMEGFWRFDNFRIRAEIKRGDPPY